MARPLRIEHVGGYYHITARGVARGTIFFDDEDRSDFLRRLGEAHERWGLVIHGYALMTNHYHAEIETPEGNLSRAMQWLNHVYAAGVNRRHARVGHLFQGRFKCVLVEAETQLHRLTRYVHLNPVRAGIVDHPRDYRWSSYRAYVGRVKPPSWLDVSRTLNMFGRTRREQRRAYRQFVAEDVAEDPLKEMVFGAVLGTREFVEWAQRKLDGMAEDREVTSLMKAFRRPTLEAICGTAAAMVVLAGEARYAVRRSPRRSHVNSRDGYECKLLGRRGIPGATERCRLDRERSAVLVSVRRPGFERDSPLLGDDRDCRRSRRHPAL